MYNFDEIVSRENTDCLKWDRLGQSFGNADALPFWVADMDFPVMPELAEAIRERATHPNYGYTFASEAYYENFIHWNRSRNQFSIQKEEILSVPGVLIGLGFFLHSLVGKGEKVLFCSPVYNPFYQVVRDHGCEIVTSSLVWRDSRYEMDFDDLEKKMSEGVRAFILCNPHNPVGRVWERDELVRLSELCARHNVLVFSDDIHSDLIYPGHTYTPFLSVSEEARERTVLAMAPSKTFNVAGLSSSLLVVPNPEIRKTLQTGLGAFHVGVNLFGLKATEIAYGIGSAWVDELTAYLADSAGWVKEYCDTHLPKIGCYVPEGTYLLWLDFRAFGLPQKELTAKLVHECGVALNDGSMYGAEGVGFMRFNTGTSQAMLKRGLDRVLDVFAKM